MGLHQGADMDDLHGWLRLQATPGIGAQTAAALLRRYGSPADIFRQSRAELAHALRPEAAQALSVVPPDLASLVARVEIWQTQPAEGVQHAVWSWADAHYPAPLLALHDPPLLLYVQGQADRMRTPAVALVGSRNPTAQGLENARAFANHLSQAGHCIVSGLAWGIDAAAHQGALDNHDAGALCPTLAVVGTGLDRVYPVRNANLAQRIAQRGLLVSEYPPGTAPLAHHFPQRNRLIAAFSSAVLVVEASMKSGSLITAQLALEMGRDVMAIPGSIHSAQSRGCHALIRQGAKLVESAQDVLEELTPGQAPERTSSGQPHAAPAPSALLHALGFDPVTLDQLSMRCGMDVAALQAGLFDLEWAGEVARLPGGFFQRVARAP